MNGPARPTGEDRRKSTLVNLDLTNVSMARRAVGVAALLLPAAVLAWLILGVFRVVPVMTDVLGVEGLRLPAGMAVGGLLVAALAFWNP